MELVTKNELQLLKELRERVSDLKLSPELDQDKNLVRWLRARKGNVSAAEQMMRKNHFWLKDRDMDELASSPDPHGWGGVPGGGFPWHFSGYDNDHNPVFIFSLGDWDVRGAMNNGQGADFEKYSHKILELIWRACFISSCSKSLPWMCQFVGIYDFKGLAFSQVTCLDVIQLTMAMTQSFDSNYPELLRKGFVVNAPYAFQILFKLVRPALDERTYNKLSVLGSDVAVMSKEIATYVPLDQFPEMYGGEGQDDFHMTIGSDGFPCKKRMITKSDSNSN